MAGWALSLKWKMLFSKETRGLGADDGSGTRMRMLVRRQEPTGFLDELWPH